MIAAEVFLWNTRIGVVIQDSITDIPRFSYDEKFLKSRIEVSPIVMPLSKRIYQFPALNPASFHYLPGLLADSLPDKYGNKLIERYLTDLGRDLASFGPIERLCYTGKRGMGALEYVPDKSMSVPDKSIDINSLVQLASDILTERATVHVNENNHIMQQILKIGTSAGGARAKAIIAWNQETKDIRSGQVNAGDGYSYWLIKFDGVSNNKDHGDKADCIEYTKIEYAYYLMAKEAEIQMSECRLYKEEDKYHFMTKRFDRTEQGAKLHMQSLGAIAHYDYNSPGVYSYEQAADIIYRLHMGQSEIEQLFRRLVFNVVARNQDDHVKNLSFLMDKKGIWQLAPAYDVTYSYDPTNMWLAKHQMSVNGKVEQITLDDLYACGRHMNISDNRIKRIVEQVISIVVNWEKYAEMAELQEQTMQEIKGNHILLLHE